MESFPSAASIILVKLSFNRLQMECTLLVHSTFILCLVFTMYHFLSNSSRFAWTCHPSCLSAMVFTLKSVQCFYKKQISCSLYLLPCFVVLLKLSIEYRVANDALNRVIWGVSNN